MKILSTLILMTISTFAFADVEFNHSGFITVPAADAIKAEAGYSELMDKVNAKLEAENSSYSYEEVKSVSSIVAKEVNSCKEGSFVEILECKQNIADLAEVLAQDVIKTHK